MLTVFLENQEIIAPVGWYEEERKKGVKLSVSVYVTLHAAVNEDHIENTVDYTGILQIVHSEAALERKLLETLAQGIIDSIHKQWTRVVQNVEVVIRKKLENHKLFQAESVGIKIKQSFDNS